MKKILIVLLFGFAVAAVARDISDAEAVVRLWYYQTTGKELPVDFPPDIRLANRLYTVTDTATATISGKQRTIDYWPFPSSPPSAAVLTSLIGSNEYRKAALTYVELLTPVDNKLSAEGRALVWVLFDVENARRKGDGVKELTTNEWRAAIGEKLKPTATAIKPAAEVQANKP